MKNLRNALLAMLVLAGAAAVAADSGIEVLRVSGIEVLTVDTHSWGAPAGSTVHAVVDLGAGPILLSMAPVDPATGAATVIFPINHSSARVELHGPGGELLNYDSAVQWDH